MKKIVFNEYYKFDIQYFFGKTKKLRYFPTIIYFLCSKKI